jgi:class 3 adenylate cyclase
LWEQGIGLCRDRVLAFVAVADCFRGGAGDNHFAEAAYQEAQGWNGRSAPVGGIGLDAPRGWLALRLGHLEDARRWFEDGLTWAEREGCPIEVGRNLQGFADLAEMHGDISEAVSLLNRAAAIYQSRGVKMFLDEVIAKKVELQGITSGELSSSIVVVTSSVQAERPDLSVHAAPDGTVTLMFTDILDSTALTEEMGDAKWVEILREHNAAVERAVEAHGGKVVKNRGDGYMLIFARPERGLDCAVAIQQALAGHEVIRVRIGLHLGNPVREGDDFFGTDVNFAARVAERALGGQVLISARVYEVVKSHGVHSFDEPLEVEFKGFAGKHRVYAVAGGIP